jgi:nucleoside triphosphatase
MGGLDRADAAAAPRAEEEGTGPAPARLVVVALVRNASGDYLLCRMPPTRGVFPGQWGLPGGGMEPGETIEQALRREVREEVGLELTEIRPLFFKERTAEKLFGDGRRRRLHMVFLVHECRSGGIDVRLNEEFEAAEWVSPARLRDFDLNDETGHTLRLLGL